MSVSAAGIDRKYVLWGSLFAFGGAAALAYVFYPQEKKHLYEDVDDEREDETVEVESDEESESVMRTKDVLVMGLEGAGKSSLLASLCGNREEKLQPTDGFNVLSFMDAQGTRLNLVELGGAEKNRQYWRHFYTKKDMVVVVIDASNQNKFSPSAILLKELLAEDNLRGLPFIIVANKQDKTGALDGDVLITKLKLSSFDPALRKRNIYHVQTQAPLYNTHKGVSELKNLISTCK